MFKLNFSVNVYHEVKKKFQYKLANYLKQIKYGITVPELLVENLKYGNIMTQECFVLKTQLLAKLILSELYLSEITAICLK